MNFMGRLLVILTLFGLFASCERSAPSHSRVRISIGDSSPAAIASNISAQISALPVETIDSADLVNQEDEIPAVSGCVICLKSVLIHIDGADFPTMAYTKRVRNIIKPGEQLRIFADFEVPTGTDRRFQILALYFDSSTSELKLQYGTTLANIANPDEYIDVKMDVINDASGNSAFKVSNINGRFLTATDAGPTGEVKVFYTHKGFTNMKLFFGRGEILNGWFSFFASENFPLTYKMADTGEVLFDREKTGSLPSSASVVHVTKPDNFWQTIATTWYQTFQPGNVVYGFFGPAVASQGVAVENRGGLDVASPLSNMSSDGGTTLLNFHYKQSVSSGSAPDIYAEGGAPVPFSSIMNKSLYYNNVIYVSQEQFNGNGYFGRAGLQGAFTAFNTSTQFFRFKPSFDLPNKFVAIEAMALPGLFEGAAQRYDTVRLFMKEGFSESNQAPNCGPYWLAKNSFQEVSFSNISIDRALGRITFTFDYPEVSYTKMYLLCPTLLASGETESIGGMFLGPVAP